MQIFNPDGPDRIFPTPPGNSKPSPNNSQLGKNPGLVTSSGGIFGLSGYLLTPVFNTISQNSYVLLMDPSNFNCEENCEFDFVQEIPPRDAPQEGRDVTLHLAILKYRELGYATFNLNITVFQKSTDSFVTTSYPILIPYMPLSKARRSTFPDKRIHTYRFGIEVAGERPQASITSFGNSGPYSITSLTLCGNADETPQI